MNFKDQLIDSSRFVGDLVAGNVGYDPQHYAEILELVLHENMPISSRAGRVLNICTENNPSLFSPHIQTVIDEIKKGRELHRSLLKVFAEIPYDLDEEQEGVLVDACFKWLSDDSTSVAVKIYCMGILSMSAIKEPDLIPELISVLEDIIPYGTPGIKNKAGRTIKQLKKQYPA